MLRTIFWCHIENLFTLNLILKKLAQPHQNFVKCNKVKWKSCWLPLVLLIIYHNLPLMGQKSYLLHFTCFLDEYAVCKILRHKCQSNKMHSSNIFTLSKQHILVGRAMLVKLLTICFHCVDRSTFI